MSRIEEGIKTSSARILLSDIASDIRTFHYFSCFVLYDSELSSRNIARNTSAGISANIVILPCLILHSVFCGK